jgi:hypothetical protein
MASTYSPLKVELIGTGEQAGTWGTTTNTNLGTALEEAITGRATATFPSDANYTLPYTDSNGSQVFRNLVLNVTSSGNLTVTRDLIIPAIEKQYIVENNTSGSQSIRVKTAAGTGVTIPSGKIAHVFCNGTDTRFADDFVAITGGTISGITLGALGTPLPVTSGGTGIATFDQGDIIYTSALNTFAKLTKSTTATRYLSNTGTSNNPAWAQINLANGVTGALPEANGGTGGTVATFGFKNRIINGAMMIDQWNNGSSSSGTDVYPVDRYIMRNLTDGTITAQRSTVAPAGFSNSLLFTVTGTDTSIGSTQYFNFRQRIEGNNIVDLGFGTASPASIAVSFWVRSSVTGTFGVALTNSDDSRLYPTSFTISSANTWEYKTITLTADTTGTWLGGTSIGLQVIFSLVLGSSFQGATGAWAGTTVYGPTGMTNFAQTNGSTFYITGLQVERNTVATSFDYRPFPTELALCQRYFFKATDYSLGYTYANNLSYLSSIRFPTTMRTAPSLESGASFTVQSGSAGTPALIGVTGGQTTVDQAPIYNLSSNWTSAVAVSITAGFNAEFTF